MKKEEGQATTLVLYGSDEYALDELSESVKNAFKVLNNLLRQPFVFLGAGALEIHLADFLKKKIPIIDKPILPESIIPVQILRNFMRKGLENVLKIFEWLSTMGEHDLHSRDVLEELWPAVNSGKVYGWDPWEKRLLQLSPIQDKKQKLVLESFSAKIHAINLAFEVTNSIIRANEVLYTN